MIGAHLVRATTGPTAGAAVEAVSYRADTQIEESQNLVEQGLQLTQQTGKRRTVEKPSHGTQQVAGTGHRDDVRDHARKVDLEAQEVQVESSENQVEDVAGRSVGC